MYGIMINFVKSELKSPFLESGSGALAGLTPPH